MQSDPILHFWFEELTTKQHFVKDATLDETIGDEVRVSMERVSSEPDAATNDAGKAADGEAASDKLTSSKMAQRLSLETAELLSRATEKGYLLLTGDKHTLTPKGEKAGVEFVAKSRFGPYFLWPQDFHPV